MNTIRLTGHVLDWDEQPEETEIIREEDRAEYEAKGYFVIAGKDGVYTTRLLSPADGDITIQSKTDMHGRMAMEGGHTNWGYSGYFRGYVYLKGERKNLVDFWAMFPNNEHRYAAQHDKARAEEAIRTLIELLGGTNVVKVIRGYAFDPAAHAERGRKA